MGAKVTGSELARERKGSVGYLFRAWEEVEGLDKGSCGTRQSVETSV